MKVVGNNMKSLEISEQEVELTKARSLLENLHGVHQFMPLWFISSLFLELEEITFNEILCMPQLREPKIYVPKPTSCVIQ